MNKTEKAINDFIESSEAEELYFTATYDAEARVQEIETDIYLIKKMFKKLNKYLNKFTTIHCDQSVEYKNKRKELVRKYEKILIKIGINTLDY